jgi:hypothetical protein
VPPGDVNVPGDYFSLAGFEVTTYGRFWVTPEDNITGALLGCRFRDREVESSPWTYMSSSQDLLDGAIVLITTRITRRELVRCDKLVTTPYRNEAE